MDTTKEHEKCSNNENNWKQDQTKDKTKKNRRKWHGGYSVEKCNKEVWWPDGHWWFELKHRRRQLYCSGRTVRLWKIHNTAYDHRTWWTDFRRYLHWRKEDQRLTTRKKRHCHGFPELCSVSDHDSPWKYRIWSGKQESAKRREKEKSPGDLRGSRPNSVPGP